MAEKTEMVQVPVTPVMKEKLVRIAESLDVSVAHVARSFITEGLERAKNGSQRRRRAS